MSDRNGRYLPALGGLVAAVLLCGAAAPEKTLHGASGAVQQQTPQDHGGEPKTQNQPGQVAAPQQPQAQPQQPNPSTAEASDGKPSFATNPLSWLAAWIFDPGNFSNFLIMVFTGLLVRVSFKQHALEERLATDTSESIEIARKSADAALLSARVSQAALLGGTRPMLVVEWTTYSPGVPPPKEPAASHPIEIEFKVTNVGERNAIVESFFVETFAEYRDPGRPYPAPSAERLAGMETMATDLLEAATTIMPTAYLPAKYTGYVSMLGDDLQSMWGLGRRRLLLSILITYRDPYRVRREQGVTLFYSPLAKYPNQWSRFEGLPYEFDRIVDLGDLDFRPEKDGQRRENS
jgi:hypothetical protein